MNKAKRSAAGVLVFAVFCQDQQSNVEAFGSSSSCRSPLVTQQCMRTAFFPCARSVTSLNLSTREDYLWGSGKSFRNNDQEQFSTSKKLTKGLQKFVTPTTPKINTKDEKNVEQTSSINVGMLSAVALLGLGCFLVQQSGVDFSAIPNPASVLQSVVQKVDGMGPMGIVYFAVLYIVAEVVAIPAMPLTASAGYLFGWQQGTAVVLFSATIAASIGFTIARTFLREKVVSMIEHNPKFKVIDRAIEKEGFKLMLLLRMSPIFPFSLSNYLYGTTSIKFWEYFLGTLIGFAPGTFAYVYTGSVGKSLFEGDATQPWYIYVAGIAVLAGLLKVVADFATTVFEEIAEQEDSSSSSSSSTSEF